jgi:GNAT superfamily N-acetyltransferase
VLKIELLASQHDRAAFDCGVPALNDYLQRLARQQQSKGVSQTHVIVEEQQPSAIVGFFSLAATKCNTSELPPELARKLPRDVPALLLGRLAVDVRHQGKGLGDALVVSAVQRAALVAKEAGIVGLFVDAKDDRAAAFYRRHGFKPTPSDTLRLFLPRESILRMAEE